MLKVTRYISLGALFLIPLVPLVVGQNVNLLFQEAHGFFSGLILTLIVIARVPFIFFGSFQDLFFPFITGKAFVFRFLVEIAVAAWAVLAFMDTRYRPQFSWIGAVALGFVGWMFIADLLSPNVSKAMWSNFERAEGWVLLIHLLGFFVVAGTVLTVERQWRTWFLVSLGVSLILVFYSILQLGGVLQIHQGSTRIDATFGNSIYFAIYLLFNVGIAGWLALTESRPWLKWSLLGLAGVEAVLIFFTETRGTILALLGALFLGAVLVVVTSKGPIRKYGLIGLSVLILLVGSFYLARNTSFVQNSSLQRLATISLSAGQTRFTLWGMASAGFVESPILGYGQEGFNYVFNKHYNPNLYAQEPWFDRAHNSYIDWLMAGGLPAFLLFIGLFGVAIWSLWKSKLPRVEQIVLTCMIVGYAVHEFFVFDNLYAYVYFFAVLAVIHGQVARPFSYFEKSKKISDNSGWTLALPISAATLLAVMFFVNGPGLSTNTKLIKAISPSSGGLAENQATFQDLADHPSYASQEVREQLVSFAQQVSQASNVPNETKKSFASLAVSEMQKQIQAYPDDARERLQLAMAYRASGDLKSALGEIETAALLSPNKEQIHIQLGAIKIEMGDSVGAKQSFTKAYELGPQFPDLAQFAIAGHFLVGESAEAKKIMLATFSTSTIDSEILNSVYVYTKNFPNLIALWKLRVSYPDAPLASFYGLAQAYYASGDLQMTVGTLQRAALARPESKEEIQTVLTELHKSVGGQ